MAAVTAVFALIAIDLSVLPSAAPARAAEVPAAMLHQELTGAEVFQPGLIISDTLFYDSNAMSASDVQSFLDAKIGTCRNSNCLNIAYVAYPGRAREVSSSTGNVICEAIPAGTVRVSRLIYEAQVACGISAKVILVTLQKEQGLVTNNAPSDNALRAAMGMACPDTAPCDSAFAGLGNQIVSGARQLKVYKAAVFGRQPGVQFIAWSPKVDCPGGSYVDIQNYATAALYNYTPYQPDAAALANLHGNGDYCSSYGNRNFWVYYTDWFGSTTGGGRAAIDAAYEAAGGLATLGAGVAYLSCPLSADRCWPQYAKGSIYWSLHSGADIVLGAKDTAYRALGGPDSPLGYPITGEYTYTQNGGGTAQLFENGTLFESAAGIYPSYGAVRTAYFVKQGSWGDLGWPTSGVRCESANCSQIYQHGAIAVVGADVSYISQGERDVWVAAGGMTGSLGTPMSNLVTYSQNGGGTTRVYTGGSIFSSPAGTFAVTDPVRTGYFAQQGAWGFLGWPSSAVQCAAAGCWQKFQHGAVVTHGSAAYAFTQAEFDAYQAVGGPSGVLGFPSSDQYTYTENGGGTTRVFANGSLFTSAAGSFAVTDPIRVPYFAQRGAWGALGWPTSAMTCTSGTCTQQFQGGTLSNAGTAPPTGGSTDEATAVYMGRITVLASQSGLGSPTSDMLVYTQNGGGVARVYGNSTVFSSAAGAFVVSGGIRAAYFAKQGAWGDYGWPTGVQQCGFGACWQQFQNGVVFTSSAGDYALTSAEYSAYMSLGGPAGKLGLPASDLITYTQNGGGTTQVFTGGSLFTSAAGTFAVTGTIKTAYFAKQGAWGDLGWPSGVAITQGNTVVQMFQNGAVAVIGVVPQYIGATERDAWVAAGGPSGVLGIPDSSVYTYTQNGGGTTRIYTGGSIFTSGAGTFAITDPIRTAYFAKQGAWGDLGWPISAPTTIGGITSQNFQHGAISVNGSTVNYLGAAERDLWIASGGPSGTLGMPQTPFTYTENGGGTGRAYTNGTIFVSPAGMFSVTDPIRTTYFAAQGAWGTYGWPTSAMTCTSGTCTQTFQGGTITAPSA